MHCFLGIEAHYTSIEEIQLTQTQYIKDLLSKAGMANAKSMPTPMMSSLKLSAHGDVDFEDPTFYRYIVGGLQYATLTRLYIYIYIYIYI